jgi:hypothetical protein
MDRSAIDSLIQAAAQFTNGDMRAARRLARRLAIHLAVKQYISRMESFDIESALKTLL